MAITKGAQTSQLFDSHTTAVAVSGIGTGGAANSVFFLAGIVRTGDATQHIYSVSQTNVTWSEKTTYMTPTPNGSCEIWVGVATGTPGADLTVSTGDYADTTPIALLSVRFDLDAGGAYSIAGWDHLESANGASRYYSDVTCYNSWVVGQTVMVGAAVFAYGGGQGNANGSTFTDIAMPSGWEPYGNFGWWISDLGSSTSKNYTVVLESGESEWGAIGVSFKEVITASLNRGAYYM